MLKQTLLLSCLALLVGCESISYYSHVAKGQWQLLQAREPIEDLVADPQTDAGLRARLQSVQIMRRFASDELQLPDNQSYHDYVALGRSHVVWNVFAAQEFSVAPKQWCFPIAGCVSYRGYFTEQQAQAFADGLRAQGYESYVGGVSAYSTLGWFDDPVLSSFLRRNDTQLAGLIFHELAHQQLYVKGDTTFNESFATAVEYEGIRRWLAHQQQPASSLEHYYRQQRMQRDFVATMLLLRERLEQLYRQPIDEEVMRGQKQRLIEDFIAVEYLAFKQRWQTESYDQWLNTDFNNAKLATVASYHQWLPAFQQLLHEAGDLQVFYQKAQALGQLEPESREQALQSLLIRHQQLNLQTQ